jgi:hypothetical protein
MNPRRLPFVPDNIMNQTSVLQMGREVLPLPFLDLLGMSSPFLSSLLHALKIFLRNPSPLLPWVKLV